MTSSLPAAMKPMSVYGPGSSTGLSLTPHSLSVWCGWHSQSSRQNATILVLYSRRRDTTANQYGSPMFVTTQWALKLIKRHWQNKVGENVTILWVRDACCIWFKIKTEAVMIKSLYQPYSNESSCLHDKIIGTDVFCSEVALVQTPLNSYKGGLAPLSSLNCEFKKPQ